MKYIIKLILLLVLPISSHAITVNSAAKDVMKQETNDKKCEIFFKHYMEFINNGDLVSPYDLMDELDRIKPGLVDHCDTRRDEYL